MQVSFSCHPLEANAYQAAAKQSGQTFSAYVADIIRAHHFRDCGKNKAGGRILARRVRRTKTLRSGVHSSVRATT